MRKMWTGEEDVILRKLCATGVDFKIISEGNGRTENACIARAYRLGIVNGCQTIGKICSQPVKDKKLADLPQSRRAALVESPDPVTLLEHKDHQCRYPLGDVRSPEFRYCGNDRGAHEHYCDGHASVCSRKVPRRANINPDWHVHRSAQSPALRGVV